MPRLNHSSRKLLYDFSRFSVCSLWRSDIYEIPLFKPISPLIVQESTRLSPNNIEIIIIQIASIFQRLFWIYFVSAYEYSCAQGRFLQFHLRVPADLVWWISRSRDKSEWKLDCCSGGRQYPRGTPDRAYPGQSSIFNLRSPIFTLNSQVTSLTSYFPPNSNLTRFGFLSSPLTIVFSTCLYFPFCFLITTFCLMKDRVVSESLLQ